MQALVVVHVSSGFIVFGYGLWRFPLFCGFRLDEKMFAAVERGVVEFRAAGA